MLLNIEVYLEDIYPLSTSIEITAETWNDWFESWMAILQPELPTAMGYEVGLRLTDDREIQSLNAQYRQQDKPTDVLSFAALEVETNALPEDYLASEPLYLGDIIISIDTAKRQAKEREHSLKWEIVWLASHGFLHLLGWDHPDEESLTEMLSQQETLLESIGLR
jgi:probable rRNA maturation factor